MALATNGTVPPGEISYTVNLGTQINLPSVDEDVYTEMTGVTSTFLKKVKDNIGRFKEISGLGVCLKVVLCDINSDERYLKEMIEFAQKEQVYVEFFPVVVTSSKKKGLLTSKVIRAVNVILPNIIISEGITVVRVVSSLDAWHMITSDYQYEYYVRLDGTVHNTLFHAYSS